MAQDMMCLRPNLTNIASLHGSDRVRAMRKQYAFIEQAEPQKARWSSRILRTCVGSHVGDLWRYLVPDGAPEFFILKV
eukprot:11741394-Ditylum_brightwellii.AAC.1